MNWVHFFAPLISGIAIGSGAATLWFYGQSAGLIGGLSALGISALGFAKREEAIKLLKEAVK